MAGRGEQARQERLPRQHAAGQRSLWRQGCRPLNQTRNGESDMRSKLMSELLAGAALLLPPTRADAAEINLMSWGGHYLDTFRPVADAFEKETGHKVNIVVMSGAKDGLTKITAQKNDPQVDVWLSIESTAQAAAEAGLLADLKPELLPN